MERTRDDEFFDVVVVGASIAGCTAATLFARHGLTVALVEKHAHPYHYKRLCTHYIQGSARPTIERLRVATELKDAGAVRNGSRLWTRWGWIDPPESDLWGYNVRRSTLDPLLRRTAAATDGVELYLGWRVRHLVRRSGRVDGVVAEDRDGTRRRLRGRLVVGADGANSTVADLADVSVTTRPNERFAYFAHFRGVELVGAPRSSMWLLEPDVAYAFPNDDGITVLACMPTKAWLSAFDADRDGTFRRFLGSLPEGPGLQGAEQVSPLMGTRDHPLRRRPAAPVPGLALVGDAATTSDPLWGIGCGWAFQSAEWLVDSTASALAAGGRGLADGVARYRRARRHLDWHDRVIADIATGRDLNPVEQSLFAAATRDDHAATVLERFGTRQASVGETMRPRTIRHTRRVNRRFAAAAGTAPAWHRPSGPEQVELTVNGLATPTLTAGPQDLAEAVVCLHGNPGSGKDWGQLAAALADRGLRTIAPDMPGFGTADKPRDFDHTVDGYAHHLDALLDALGIETAHLVLHDFGGPWGLVWAARHPAAVGSLTLVDTGVPLGHRWHTMARIWRTPVLGEAMMHTTTRAAFRTLLSIGCPRTLPAGFVDDLYDDFDARTKRAVLRLYRATPDLNALFDGLRAPLSALDVPVQVVWGRQDPYLPLAQAYRQRDVFADADVHVLDHSGHWPFVDDPARFRAVVVPFLERAVASRGARAPVPTSP